MKDRQKIFLDKVLKILLEDTIIDFKKNEILLPFLPIPYPLPFSPSLLHSSSFFHLFTNYCKERYGLTDQEIEYVWKEYKSIIEDNIY